VSSCVQRSEVSKAFVKKRRAAEIMRLSPAVYHNSKLFGVACVCFFYFIASGKAEQVLSWDYHAETISVGFGSIQANKKELGTCIKRRENSGFLFTNPTGTLLLFINGYLH
jgi:hypothetical protein